MRHTSALSGFVWPIFTDTVAMALPRSNFTDTVATTLTAKVQLHGYGRSGACATYQHSQLHKAYIQGYSSCNLSNQSQ
ncbi:hypothetical protein D3C81_1816720 [compost metagenome]